VLKVSNRSGSVLITADIEKQVEQHLLQAYQQHLRADVLIVPHHGSLTSSSEPFIKQVSPKYALVSAGYMNRFRHPRPEIVRRYEEQGVKVLNTANQGAMSIKFNENSDLVEIEGYRKQHNQYWNHAH
jgi:competence protein ComEC